MSPPRVVRLGAACNTRDVGGYRTADGLTTRWRTLLRSGNAGTLTPADHTRLATYRLHSVIDLRRDDELTEARCAFADLDQVRYVRIPFGDLRLPAPSPGDSLGDLYRLGLERRRDEYRAVLAELARPGALPALVQCSAGRDRTGCAVALVLGVLGVPEATIVQDYTRSQCPPDAMRAALAFLAADYGGVVGYCNAIGLSAAEQARLREALIAPRTI